jgi:hypothetical protein
VTVQPEDVMTTDPGRSLIAGLWRRGAVLVAMPTPNPVPRTQIRWRRSFGPAPVALDMRGSGTRFGHEIRDEPPGQF